MKDDEIRVPLQRLRNLLKDMIKTGEIDEHSMLAALDHVLDEEFGVIAAKKAGWALAHERANVMQQLSTENDLLKLRVAELEKVAMCFECKSVEPNGFSGRCKACTRNHQARCRHEHFDHALGACHDCGIGEKER